MMKKTFLLRMILAVCCWVLVVALAACDGKQSASSTANEQEKENVETEVPEKDEQTEAVESADDQEISENTAEKVAPLSLSDWQKALASGSLQVAKTMNDPKARDFAQVFCQEHSDFGANALLLKYLKSPNSFDAKAENCKIVDDRPNGFVKCEKYALFDNQDDESIEACRWMRKNGHSLVGIFMHSSNDASANHYAYAFYDYDPATGKMMPDKDVLGVVAHEIERLGGDDLLIQLPQKGKDLEIKSFEFSDGDLHESAHSTLHWMGEKFQ